MTILLPLFFFSSRGDKAVLAEVRLADSLTKVESTLELSLSCLKVELQSESETEEEVMTGWACKAQWPYSDLQ